MAMVQPNYSINISRKTVNGAGLEYPKHFGVLELGFLVYDVAWQRYEEVSARFPSSEGWTVSLSQVSCYAQEIASSQEK